jgi:serine/threonine protein kinase
MLCRVQASNSAYLGKTSLKSPFDPAMKTIQLDKLTGIKLDNDVVLTALLGQGGMGVVYRATQQSFNREICVKFLRPELVPDATALARFRKEGAFLSKVRHEHIVNVYYTDIFHDVFPYLAMELVEGISLRTVITTEKKLSPTRACKIFIELCDTMMHVHSAGIIHRDLKPENVMLVDSCCEPPADFTKIIDFGLGSAMRVDNRLTRTSVALGTPWYMAPECFLGAQHNTAVDIYALGCMFYEALTGERPFVADSAVALGYKHRHNDVPSLPEDTCPRAQLDILNAVLRTACAKTPEERFADSGEMARWINEAINEKPDIRKLNVTRPGIRVTDRKKQLSVIAFSIAALAGSITLANSHWLDIRRDPDIDDRSARLLEQQAHDGGDISLCRQAALKYKDPKRALVAWEKVASHAARVGDTAGQIESRNRIAALNLPRTHYYERIKLNSLQQNLSLPELEKHPALVAQTCNLAIAAYDRGEFAELLSEDFVRTNAEFAWLFSRITQHSSDPRVTLKTADKAVAVATKLLAHADRIEHQDLRSLITAVAFRGLEASLSLNEAKAAERYAQLTATYDTHPEKSWHYYWIRVTSEKIIRLVRKKQFARASGEILQMCQSPTYKSAFNWSESGKTAFPAEYVSATIRELLAAEPTTKTNYAIHVQLLDQWSSVLKRFCFTAEQKLNRIEYQRYCKQIILANNEHRLK